MFSHSDLFSSFSFHLQDIEAEKESFKETLDNLKQGHEDFLSKHAALDNVDPHDLAAQIAKARDHWDSIYGQYGDQLREPIEKFSDWMDGVEAQLIGQGSLLHRYAAVKAEQSEPLQVRACVLTLCVFVLNCQTDTFVVDVWIRVCFG